MRERVKTLEDKEKAREEEDTKRRRALRVFGDIGFRFQHVSTDGAATKAAGGVEENRLEGLLRFGATGFIFDQEKHRMRYEARLAITPAGDFSGPLGAPTVGWRAADALGTGSPVMLDRLYIEHTYKGWLRIAGGRYGHTFRGSQLIFDHDIALTGVSGTLDLGRFTKSYASSDFDIWRDFDPPKESGFSRLHAIGAAYVMAQDEHGMPAHTTAATPHGLSAQVASKYRFKDTGASVGLTLGYHWFEQAEGVAPNISTGTTFTTTNRVDGAGIVRSKFRVAEMLFEYMALEQQSASLRLFAHWTHNLARGDMFSKQFKSEGSALVLGMEWGALEFEESSTFRIALHWHYIEPDATIPEFNQDALNTNYKGFFFGIKLAILKNLIPFSDFHYGTRVDQAVGGFGVTASGAHGNPSDDWLFRARLGVMIHF